MPSLPCVPVGSEGSVGVLEPCWTWEKPAWELLGCREVTRHALTLSCRTLLLLLIPSAGLAARDVFDFYFEVLHSSLNTLFNSSYPPVRANFPMCFFFSGHCPLQLILVCNAGAGGVGSLVLVEFGCCTLDSHLMLFLFSFSQDRVMQK